MVNEEFLHRLDQGIEVFGRQELSPQPTHGGFAASATTDINFETSLAVLYLCHKTYVVDASIVYKLIVAGEGYLHLARHEVGIRLRHYGIGECYGIGSGVKHFVLVYA